VGDALLVAAGLFAVVAGANDGSSVLSAGLAVPGLRPLISLAVLLVAVVAGPCLLFGTGVATSLAERLVPFGSVHAGSVVLDATSVAVLVVSGLVWAGVPTSLTVALVGSIAGAGLGAGLPVSARELAEVVLFGLAAPVASAALAFVVAPTALRAAGGAGTSRRLRRWHGVAFCLQCLAYSANGGQKMLAVFALAVGAASGGLVRAPWWLAALAAALFGLGALGGVRNVSANIGRGIFAVHSRHAVVAETCSFAVVMSAGLLGVPLTMSQSVAGALVGAGLSESRGRVRWAAVVRMTGAWALTLPASIGLAAFAGVLTRWA